MVRAHHDPTPVLAGLQVIRVLLSSLINERPLCVCYTFTWLWRVCKGLGGPSAKRDACPVGEQVFFFLRQASWALPSTPIISSPALWSAKVGKPHGSSPAPPGVADLRGPGKVSEPYRGIGQGPETPSGMMKTAPVVNAVHGIPLPTIGEKP